MISEHSENRQLFIWVDGALNAVRALTRHFVNTVNVLIRNVYNFTLLYILIQIKRNIFSFTESHKMTKGSVPRVSHTII